jgi:hypothetical protein
MYVGYLQPNHSFSKQMLNWLDILSRLQVFLKEWVNYAKTAILITPQRIHRLSNLKHFNSSLYIYILSSSINSCC